MEKEILEENAGRGELRWCEGHRVVCRSTARLVMPEKRKHQANEGRGIVGMRKGV